MASKKESFGGSFFNSRLTATISISLVLFLLGMIALMGLMANSLAVYVKENISFTIELKDDMTLKSINSLQKSLADAPFVRSTQYISKEQASKELAEEIGEDPALFLGFNPLSASIEVNLKSSYAHPDSIAMIERFIRSDVGVREVLYQQDLLQMVNENMTRIGFVLLLLAVVLMAISFALISNTIRLMVYSKRFLIYTMKLVGATNGFIRRPFLVANLGMGLVSSVLALAMMVAFFYYLLGEVPNLVTMFEPSVTLSVVGIVFGLGIVIALISTCLAVNRYLRMKVDTLYHV